MGKRLLMKKGVLPRFSLNRNKMIEIKEYDSDSIESIKSSDSQRNSSEKRLTFKRKNPASDVLDKFVKTPKLAPVELIELTQEVKEEEENFLSFDKEFSPEIHNSFFGTDCSNDIDPFCDLPDPLESVKQEPVKENEPATFISNETCTQEVQNPEPNLTFNDVSTLISEMKDNTKETEVVTSVPVNHIPRGIILSLPTHSQKEPNLINIPSVVKLKQVFPRIIKKTSKSQVPQIITNITSPAVTTTSERAIAPLILRTRMFTNLKNVEKVSKKTGTDLNSERKTILHNKESEVEEEFFTKTKEHNMSSESLTIRLILRNPYLYTGLYGTVFSSFINMIIKGSFVSCKDVLITLMKIRLDDCFRRLEDLFDVRENHARIIFGRLAKTLAPTLKKLVCTPVKKVGIIHKEIYSVIDYFYVRIHYPGDWRHDNCKYVKFLVSCTSEGVIDFVSPWYLKKQKDIIVLSCSGYIQKLEKGITVIANRKFHGIQNVIKKKNCTLIQPNSPDDAICKITEETISNYRAKLRLVFESLREFEYIGPKACIRQNNLSNLSQIMIIACAIVNSKNYSQSKLNSVKNKRFDL